MVALRTVDPHRATVADAAGSERSARLTWHPEVGRFTLTSMNRLIVDGVFAGRDGGRLVVSLTSEGW